MDKNVIDLQSRKDRAFIETQYARATNTLLTLIDEEGCCNALKPYCDALSEIAAVTDQQEENIDFAKNVLDIFSGAVDIDFDRSTKTDRLDKINEAISFLTILKEEI